MIKIRMDFEDEIRRNIHEHEVWMSFHDDDGAIYFMDWWYTQGRVEFASWLTGKGRNDLLEDVDEA